MNPRLKYIGKQISIESIRNAILDLNVNEKDAILLNPTNFDDIVFEYREKFYKSISDPYLLLGVLIKEDTNFRVPENRIGIMRNDNESAQLIESNEENFYDNVVAHRCGWCGNIVDEQGNELKGHERQRIIKYIETFPSPVIEHRHGKCCPNGN